MNNNNRLQRTASCHNPTNKNRKRSQSVLIIDDDSDICQSMKWLLESVSINVITFTCSIDFLEAFDSKTIDAGCIVTDVRMPYMSGLELLEELKLRNNKIPILVMSAHGDIPIAVRAIKSGAENFLSKPCNEQFLIEEVQKCLAKNNDSFHGQDVVMIQACYEQLTKREKEILECVVSGRLNKQIAQDLEIAISTVELHRSRIMKKMQVTTLPQLIKNYLLAYADKL